MQSNQIESAVRALSAAAPLVKSDTAYNRLGTALILTGQATQAVSAFETAASIEPANLDTQTNISLAQALSGAQAQSVATARAVTTSPRAELRHFRNLMLVLVLAGQDEQAAAVNVPDGSDAEQRAFLAEARKIRALATPAARAQAIGLLGG